MNKRILMIVMVATLVSTSGGCAPFRNFFFGRGAQCGLCTKLRAPFQRTAPVAAAPAPTCNPPAYAQPQCGPAPGYAYNPNPCATGNAYAPAANSGTCNSCYGGDPYIGNGVYGAPSSQGNWQQRSDYKGYRIDNDGNQIIYEDPLPPGATVVD